MDIARVAVVGAGTMGASIAVALANSGRDVLLKDVDERSLEKGRSRIERMLQSLVRRGLPMIESHRRSKLVRPVLDYGDLSEADLIIEAVPENLEIKTEVFGRLEACCRTDAILASSTSSLSITEIASKLRCPDRVVGLHFFNPAFAVKLVEVVAGLDTSGETVSRALKFGQSLDKLAIRVEECASFLVNRLLSRYLSEAVWCLEETTAGFDEIEKAACDLSMPIGPLALRDLNGVDIGLSAAGFNYQEYGERFRPPATLAEMVKRNWLGQKTARGFYVYGRESNKRLGINEELAVLLKTQAGPSVSRFKPERLFLPMINEAFFALQEHVCAPGDLDPACMAGVGMRKGPLAMAEELGLADCLSGLAALAEVYGERYRPCPLLRRLVLSGRKTVSFSESLQGVLAGTDVHP